MCSLHAAENTWKVVTFTKWFVFPCSAVKIISVAFHRKKLSFMKNFKFCFATSPAKHTIIPFLGYEVINLHPRIKQRARQEFLYLFSPVLHISVTGIVRVRYGSPAGSLTYLNCFSFLLFHFSFYNILLCTFFIFCCQFMFTLVNFCFNFHKKFNFVFKFCFWASFHFFIYRFDFAHRK